MVLRCARDKTVVEIVSLIYIHRWINRAAGRTKKLPVVFTPTSGLETDASGYAACLQRASVSQARLNTLTGIG